MEKIFVGSIKEDAEEDHLRNYFEQFGKLKWLKSWLTNAMARRGSLSFVTFDGE